MGNTIEPSSKETSADKKLSANVTDAESTVVSDSSVNAMACSLNVSSKNDPSNTLNFDIDSLINKESMLNPQSDAKKADTLQDNCSTVTTSYESAFKQLTKEIKNFAKILDKVQADMAENEYRADEGVVKSVRGYLKQRLSELIAKVNSFSSVALEGDIRTASVIPSVPEKVSDASMLINVNKRVDCNGHFMINRTEMMDSVMLTHMQSQFHRSVVGNPVSDSNTTIEKTISVDKTKEVKKDEVSVRFLMINRMTACLIDDSLLNCEVCGVACDARDPKSHIELKDHSDRLVAYNLKKQRELMINNLDAFAGFKLTDLNYVVNKIFVNPIGKFAYCGVCRKEVPVHQKNIEDHIDSPNHNKLLVAARDVAPKKKKEYDDVLVDFHAKSSVQQQQQKPQPSSRMDSVGAPEESSLLRYVLLNHGFRHLNGTYACLICNVNHMSTVKKISGHFSSKQHSEISNKMDEWSGVSFDQKAKLLDNFVSAAYDVQPIMYECLICGGFGPTSQLKGALDHIASDRHIQLKEQYLRQPATVQQPPHLEYAKIVHRQDMTKMYCMPCRMTLNSIVAAFEHVKSIPHNPDTLIEYIHNTGNSAYNCMACSISIRGDVALMSHAASPEHSAAKFAKAVSKMNLETNASPISTVNHMPKGFVVVEQDGSVLKNSAKKNNVKSKTVDNAASNKDKNNKEKDVKTANAKNNKNVNQKVLAEEMVFLNNNGVVHSGNDTYFCRPCRKGKMSREEAFEHIFSVQHPSIQLFK